eukprot:TRINITY_DN3812_c0_g1_i1.p1 TRINITY_DN3812_c0_g1~~TRINITY_DN3812_c0_g1_i1.p1  ORF type:complete len:764 (+),score=287.52 TRINITY_DN3812_c0_g1_i1:1375-3666(+)
MMTFASILNSFSLSSPSFLKSYSFKSFDAISFSLLFSSSSSSSNESLELELLSDESYFIFDLIFLIDLLFLVFPRLGSSDSESYPPRSSSSSSALFFLRFVSSSSSSTFFLLLVSSSSSSLMLLLLLLFTYSMGDVVLLPALPANFGGNKSLSSLASPIFGKVEHFGRSYERYLAIINNAETFKEEEPESQAQGDDDDENEERYKHHKKKTIADLVEANYYELLGLGETRWQATQDDIKKAYRKAALEHHPDKRKQASEAEVQAEDEMFKKIQTAYETLSDPKKRRAYDSQDSFDDTIPHEEDIKSDAEFFKVFASVFHRNSKWSVTAKVPTLGDESTPWEKVSQFYEFWYSFKSWRDFSYLDEYDPEEAESREEKRWMERRNAKQRDKRKNEEQARIVSLVDLAYKMDPRVKKAKELEKQAKEEKKRQRMERARQKKEEEERAIREAKQKEEEELQKIKAEEEERKKEKNRIDKLKKKKRQQIRQTAREHGISEDHAELLCEKLDIPGLEAFGNKITSSPQTKEALQKLFEDHVNEIRNVEKSKFEQKSQPQQSSKTPVEEERVVWTPEEIDLLTKAVIKFPGATRNRWEKIQEFIGTDKTIKQIIARVKSAQTGSGSGGSTTTLENQYDRWMRSKKDAGPVSSEPSQNWEKNAETPTATTPSSTTASSPSTPASSTANSSSPATTQASATTSTATTTTTTAEAEWSPDEQRALEIALKKFPASLGPERWAKIAEEVPGRSKKDCVARYKYIVNIIKQQKSK